MKGFAPVIFFIFIISVGLLVGFGALYSKNEELIRLNTELEFQISQLKNQINSMNKNIDKLNGMIADSDMQIQTLLEKVSELEESYGEALAVIQKQAETLVQDQNMLKQYEIQLATLNASLQSLKNEKVQLNQALIELSVEKEYLLRDIKELENEISRSTNGNTFSGEKEIRKTSSIILASMAGYILVIGILFTNKMTFNRSKYGLYRKVMSSKIDRENQVTITMNKSSYNAFKSYLSQNK